MLNNKMYIRFLNATELVIKSTYGMPRKPDWANSVFKTSLHVLTNTCFDKGAAKMSFSSQCRTCETILSTKYFSLTARVRCGPKHCNSDL